MNEIELRLTDAKGDITLDAELIAKDLGIEPEQVLDSMRNGRLTGLCEQGISADAGHFRLTFYHENRQLRLLLDPQRRLLERTVTIRTRGKSARTFSTAAANR